MLAPTTIQVTLVVLHRILPFLVDLLEAVSHPSMVSKSISYIISISDFTKGLKHGTSSEIPVRSKSMPATSLKKQVGLGGVAMERGNGDNNARYGARPSWAPMPHPNAYEERNLSGNNQETASTGVNSSSSVKGSGVKKAKAAANPKASKKVARSIQTESSKAPIRKAVSNPLINNACNTNINFF